MFPNKDQRIKMLLKLTPLSPIRQSSKDYCMEFSQVPSSEMCISNLRLLLQTQENFFNRLI